MGFSDFFSSFDKPKPKITMPGEKPKEKAPEAPKKDIPMKWKAGGFPFYRDEKGDLWVCLFKSNDPKFGGKAYQMPKGHPDPGEAPGQAAAREASEETGIPTRLLYKDRIQVAKQKFRGDTSTYIMYAYAFPLETKFPATTNDEGFGKWVKYDYALTVIRKDQKSFLKMARAALGKPKK